MEIEEMRQDKTGNRSHVTSWRHILELDKLYFFPRRPNSRNQRVSPKSRKRSGRPWGSLPMSCN